MRFSMPFQKTFNARQLLLELWQQRRQRFADLSLERIHVNLQKYRNRLCG